MDTPQLPPVLPPPLPTMHANPDFCCDRCQAVGPTKSVMFFQHIGAVLLMFNQHVKGRMCRNCVNAEFTKRTLVTSFFGWWGMISFFLTPIFLLNNSARYLLSLSLPPPPDRMESGRGLAITALVVALGALCALAFLVISVVRA